MTDLSASAGEPSPSRFSRFASPDANPRSTLGDFTTDLRVLRLAAMALLVGTAGAGAAWALNRLIALITDLAVLGRDAAVRLAIADHHLGALAAVIPVIGCLIVGVMARYGSEKIRGHGIPEAMEAILFGQSRIQLKVAILKPLSSAISIGTGGPFGAEGPIIMTGGAIGSLLAQCFPLSSAERKTLLVAGAAAGMAATFGTPVAAVLLAVELLLFEWKPRSFIPVAVAAVVAAAWRPLLLGPGPLFPVAAAVTLPWWGLIACAAVGLLAGLGSGLLTALVYGFEDAFQRLPIHWMWWPALGGIVVGLGGLIEPHALGVGYDNIAALLQGRTVAQAVIVLLVVKAVIWSVALGSGTSGGVLAPLLIMGGALGALEGEMIPAATPGFWALIGMAAIMGGTMRSPLTATLFAVELTGDIGALLPLLAACSVAFAVTVLLLKRSILTEKVARRGFHLSREYIVDPFETIRVAQVMVERVDTLPAEMTIDDTVAFFTAPGLALRHKSYPVVDDENRVLGLVARADVLRWTMEGWRQGAVLADVVKRENLAVAYPDELVGRLADRMAAADVGRVPVVRRLDGVLVGMVARKDLLRVRAMLIQQERERAAVIRAPRPATAVEDRVSAEGRA
ncbi:MAG TPA: chloride channel protein [Stellaceae bacterium]|nr:chloride channel protein [Stellaceae bacterium]